MVDRIIVTNKKVARVVLRAKAYEGETSIHDQVSSGALNNAAPTGNLDSSSTSTGTSGAYTWQTETFPAADANATGAAGAAKPDFTRYPSIGNHGRSVTPFYFNIGTVESFERKLEDAQKQLGISSRDYIPVIYIDETDWIEEFTRFLPTLILMGGMMFLARRAMSGGRGDGPGGIFRFVEDFSGRLAALTPGFVGADIANICNEAAIIAARRNKKGVQLEDFESATDRVIGGLESRKIMSPEEKKVVAYHEAGHAIAGWFLEHADPLLKVTIVPRGNGALGFAQYLPKELFLRTRDQILDMVCMALAGRASEEVNFGRVTTGAADDLRRVTQIVYNMVTVYGMNERVGQVAFPKEEGGFPGDRLYSDATAQVMDEEVRQIVAEAYSRTLNLIRARQQDVVKVAELLLSKETITNMDVAELIGRRPFETSKEYDEYLNYGRKPENQEETASEPAATEDATATPETAEQPPADKDPKAV
eukprot:gene11839-8438_t